MPKLNILVSVHHFICPTLCKSISCPLVSSPESPGHRISPDSAGQPGDARSQKRVAKPLYRRAVVAGRRVIVRRVCLKSLHVLARFPFGKGFLIPIQCHILREPQRIAFQRVRSRTAGNVNAERAEGSDIAGLQIRILPPERRPFPVKVFPFNPPFLSRDLRLIPCGRRVRFAATGE